MNKSIKQLEKHNVFVSIVFKRNANREKQWIYIIENIYDELYKSKAYGNKKQCKTDGIIKAIELALLKDMQFMIDSVALHSLKVAAKNINNVLKSATV